MFSKKTIGNLPRYDGRRSSCFCDSIRLCVSIVAPFRENAPYVLPKQRRKAYLHAEGKLRIKLTFRFGCEGLAVVFNIVFSFSLIPRARRILH